MKPTIFDLILSKEIPADIVYEDEHQIVAEAFSDMRV